MVATQYAYRKGRTFMRRISAAFAVLFGLFALFFAPTPRLWNAESSNQNIFTNFFAQNTAHADVPHTGDSGGGDAGGAAGDCGTDSGAGGDCGCY